MQPEFENYVKCGRFLLCELGQRSVFWLGNAGQPIELSESAGVSQVFELTGELALGVDQHWRSYHPDFVAAGSRLGRASGAMGIWNIENGSLERSLVGFHYGEVLGAEFDGHSRILTWGRDYVLRVWNFATGACIQTSPLPLWSDEDDVSYLSASGFRDLTASDRWRYADEEHLPALNVEHIWKPTDCIGQSSFIVSARAAEKQKAPRRWSVSEGGHGWIFGIRDIRDVEAGYSSAMRLADGRLCAGGTTYGTSGYFYVWDGLFELQILHIPPSDNMTLVGEVAPNEIGFAHRTGWNETSGSYEEVQNRFEV
ncbi:MAG: hypothetical protein ACFHXK_14840 [bacterium]